MKKFVYLNGMAIAHAMVDNECVIGCYACNSENKKKTFQPAIDANGRVWEHDKRDGADGCSRSCPACYPVMREAWY